MELQSELIPNKQGNLAKDTDGNLVLVNPEGKAFAVNNDISAVWLMLDGQKNLDQLVEELSTDTPAPSEKVQEIVKDALERLKSVELVTW